MKFESLASSNLSPEQKEIQKKRDAYEKQAKKDAQKQNTFFENLAGKGVDKEDVFRKDALLIDRKREDVATADENDHIFGKKRQLEILEGLQDSALTLQTVSKHDKSVMLQYKPRYGRHPALVEQTHYMKGIIGENKVNIQWKENFTKPESSKFKGTVDGKPISPELAKEIYDKYVHAAETRTYGLI